MYRVGQQAEHPPGVAGIIRFAKDFAVQNNDRISPEDGAAGFPASVENGVSLLVRNPERIGLRQLIRTRRLVDVCRDDAEREAGGGQQFRPPGGRGGENEGHRS
jgi:hypothetical protein